MGVIHAIPGYKTGRIRNGQESFNHNLWKGLVAAYSPEFGNSGDMLYDSTTGEHNGTWLTGPVSAPTAGVPVYVGGKFGNVLSLDGSSQFISIPDQRALQVEVANGASLMRFFTLAAWINVASFSSYNMIVTKANNSGASTNNFELRIDQTTGKLTLAGNGGAAVTSVNALSLNTWCFVTATYDGSELLSKVYINAKFENSHSGTPAFSITTRPVYIGVRDDDFGYFNGKIGQVLIYNRRLQPSEIQYLMANSFKMFVPKHPNRFLHVPVITTIQTVTSDSDILATQTKTILSDTDIKNTTTRTILSDSDIVNTTIQTIFSNSDITGTTTRTILSDTDIAGTTTQTIFSDSEVVSTSTQTILSDTNILVVQTKTVLSDTDIKAITTQTILSNTDIKVTTIQTVFSNTDILNTTTRTILSNSEVVVTTSVSITSETIILTPLDLYAEVEFTGTQSVDKNFEVEITQRTADQPANIPTSIPTNLVAVNTGQGDSIRLEWNGITTYYNVYRVDPGPAYIKLNIQLITDHFYVVGGLKEGVSYTFIVRGANAQG